MQKQIMFLFLLISISFFACSKSSSTSPETPEPEPTVDKIAEKLKNPSGIILVNVSESSPMFKANFNKNLYNSGASEYRLYLFPFNGSNPTVDSSIISNSNYFKYNANDDASTFEIAIKDVDGNSLELFKIYVAYVAAVNEDGTFQLTDHFSNSSTIVLGDDINGYWKGPAATNIFPNITAILFLKLVDNEIIGSAYYNTSIPPQGPSHAYTATIVGNELTNLTLSDYRGCEGTFTGSGTFESRTNIQSDTPGTDCDGTHTYFTMDITKQ